jgi:hypothetical protein
MNTKDLILEVLQDFSESQLMEVLLLVRAIRSSHQKESLTSYLLSESSLSRDWSKCEEDKAWQHL